jgi:hypothetical protein
MWFMRMKELAALGARVAVGTAVYGIIVVLAASRPAAAGLMLTFPALNGLAFFFSEDARAASIARSMLWMPVVNGVLCAGYISVFAFVATAGSAALVAWGLVGLSVAAWLACVSRDRVRKGIAQDHQLAFVAAATVIGAVLAAGGAFEATHLPVAELRAQPAPASDGVSWLAAALGRSQLKIGLFALALVIFFSSIAYLPLSDSTRGILSGLPLVPFGGLVAIAGDAAMSLDDRLQIFRGMMSGVWLSPAVAAWFIFLFSRFLGMRTRHGVSIADDALRFGALLVGWAVTFGVIVAVASAIAWLSIG